MWRSILTASLVLAAVALPALAQQPPPAEVLDAMSIKMQALQQNLDAAYLQLAHNSAAAAKAAADAEAQKATLIEWLQAAQAAGRRG